MSESRYCIIPSAAIDDPELTVVDLRVLGVISYHTGRAMTAWPKQKTIADRLGLARETVNRSVKRLERKGYIEVTHQFFENGPQRESLYLVRLDPEIVPADDIRDTEVKTQDVGGGCDATVTPGVTPTITGGVTPTITPPVTPAVTAMNLPNRTIPIELYNVGDAKGQTRSRSGSGRSPEPKPLISASVKSEFSGLWNLWPKAGKGRSKGQALLLEQFAKVCQDHPPSHVVEAAAAFVRSRDERYCPGLQRFLTDRMFEHFLPDVGMFDASTTKSAAAMAAPDPGIDWPAMVARWWRTGTWPSRLGERPDELRYAGPLEPIEAIFAQGRLGDPRIADLKRALDRIKARRVSPPQEKPKHD